MSDDANTGKALRRLTAAALTIPGMISELAALAPASEASLDYKFSAYREADMAAEDVAGGTTSRYDIDSHLLRYVAPLRERVDLAVDLSYETMSGASPWFVMPGNNGPIQVMSGASIREQRKDVQVTVSRYFSSRTVASVVGGYSDENDYRAANVGLSVDHDLPGQQTTLSGGIAYSDDALSPTDGKSMADRIDSADKTSANVFGSVTQLVNERTALQLGLSYALHDGYLSDPYKKYWVVDQSNALPDARPDRREAFTAEAKLRYFAVPANAALHLDYRYFDDDWQLASHTIDVAWYQNLPGGWQLVPSLRYYSQSQAFFYAPYFFTGRDDGYGSSDYRLSPYGAVSYRLALSKSWHELTLNLDWESYRASAQYALEDVQVENPALVDFDMLTLGMRWRWQ